jgi:RNA polymerase sporulation-specific sigma factor
MKRNYNKINQRKESWCHMNKLTNEELIKLAKDGDKEAYEFFFSKNDGLNYHFARKYSNIDNIEDLASISRIGMMKAYKSFNLDKGIKFATYASRIMVNEILMYNRKIRKTKNDISIEAPLHIDGDGNALTIQDVLPDERDDYKDLENSQYASFIIRDFQEDLNERDKAIFNGMILGKKKQREMGKELGISQSYTSRMKGRLEKKLQKRYGNGDVKMRKPSVNPNEFKYAVEKYPELTHNDLARIFGVSTPTISNNFKRLKAGKFDDVEAIIEQGGEIDKKLQNASKARLEKKKKLEEKKEDERMLDIVNSPKDEKINKFLNEADKMAVIEPSKEYKKLMLKESIKNNDKALEKLEDSKEEIIILNNKISNKSNRDEAANIIYGLYQMVKSVPKDSKIKFDISLEVSKNE